jgi:hypothetical protein
MKESYRYELGSNFQPEFQPELTPAQMLHLGVFCGKCMTDTRDEFPSAWFTHAKLSSDRRDCALNYFGVDASLPLSVWRKRDGFTLTTRAAGSNGVVDTIWGIACLRKTNGISSAGEQCADIFGRSSCIAYPAISIAAVANAKPCCTGHTRAKKSERTEGE